MEFSATPTNDKSSRRAVPTPSGQFAAAPLFPVAVAATVGVMCERYGSISMAIGLAMTAALATFAVWSYVHRSLSRRTCLIAVFAGLLAAAHHHAHRHFFPPDDIGSHITIEPKVIQVRGWLAEQPITRRGAVGDPMRPGHQKDTDITLLDVTSMRSDRGDVWIPASGRLRLTVERDAKTEDPAPLSGLTLGDSVQVIGLARRPDKPSNPGEKDYAGYLADQRIRGDLRASDSSAAVVRLDAAEFGFIGTLAYLRGRATSTLTKELPESVSPTARALLLGDGSAMDRTEWDAFIRTGVVHVLAISGQHLVLLAAFVWLVAGVLGIRRRHAAWVVMGVVIGYAVLTGLRPSAVRAALMVAAGCGAVILRRPLPTANAFSASWLAVIVLNPADIFTLGCQLSFVSVFVLIWGVARWLQPVPETALEQMVARLRPLWRRGMLLIGRAIAALYGVNVILFVVNTPLLIADQNIVSPVGVLVGPILVVLTSVALVAGFLLMLFAPIPGVDALLGTVTTLSLKACGMAVNAADTLPGGSVYVAGFPVWWTIGFYLFVAAIVLLTGPSRRIWLLAGFVWVLVGVVWPTRPDMAGELRVTFLAVGHGGCAVLETPDDRCLIYDVGTTSGPDAVRRVVAPYLWSRGITRVDEVFLSHADTDHFNNLPELLRRFPVGRITMTPSFASKPTSQVEATMLAIERYRMTTQTVAAGEHFTSGDVRIEVLHPPNDGPGTSENERSLVLAVHHAGHVVLLTGDLEKAGTARVVQLPPIVADVMQAPHHGSRPAFTTALQNWTRPKFVVVSRERAPDDGRQPSIGEGDAGPGVLVWDTGHAGAIIIRSHATGVTAESYRDGNRIIVTRGRAKN